MYKPCSSTHRSYFQQFVCCCFFVVVVFLVAFYLFQWPIQWLISFIIPSLNYLFCLYFLYIFIIIIICFCYCLFIFCQASFIVACDKRARACVRACVRVCALLWGWIHPLFGGMHAYVRVYACVYTFLLLRVGCCYDGRLESLYRYAPVASYQ